MKPGWIIGFAVAFVVLSIVAAVCEMTYLDTGETGLLQRLMQPEFPEYKIPVIGTIASVIVGAWEYIKTLWDMFWFNYPFFQGSWALIRYIFFIPVSVGVIVCLVLAAVRGVSSG